MNNKDFIIIEEYNNVTLGTDLTTTVNRFSPQLFTRDFSAFIKNLVEGLDANFFNNNHLIIASTNNNQRLYNAKSEYADYEWLIKRFTSTMFNYMEVHYSLFKNPDEQYTLAILIYLNGYYIRKHFFSYGKI